MSSLSRAYQVGTQLVLNIVNSLGYNIEELRDLATLGDSIYYHTLSWLAASLAAGGAIEATKAVYTGMVKNAVAVIRPPGTSCRAWRS